MTHLPPTFAASPFLRFVVCRYVERSGGDLWPAWRVDREVRQRNLLGWPLGRWRFDTTICCSVTQDEAVERARTEAEGE
jgi:hypothetical protein